MPVLTGSLIRVPLGMWTDKFGGRIVLFILMLSVRGADLADLATRRSSGSSSCSGLFVGLAGGSFSVGTPYVRALVSAASARASRWASSAPATPGAAVNKFVAPALVVAFGWAMVPQVYAAIMLGTALLFWFFSYSRPAPPGRLEDHVARAARGAEGPEGLEATASTTRSCSAATSR